MKPLTPKAAPSTACFELLRRTINLALEAHDHQAADALLAQLHQACRANDLKWAAEAAKRRAVGHVIAESRCGRCNAATFDPDLTCPMCRLARLERAPPQKRFASGQVRP